MTVFWNSKLQCVESPTKVQCMQAERRNSGNTWPLWPQTNRWTIHFLWFCLTLLLQYKNDQLICPCHFFNVITGDSRDEMSPLTQLVSPKVNMRPEGENMAASWSTMIRKNTANKHIMCTTDWDLAGNFSYTSMQKRVQIPTVSSSLSMKLGTFCSAVFG